MSSDIVFMFECSGHVFSFVNKGNPLHPLLWDISLSAYQLAVHFISLRRISFPLRATLAPLDLLQSELSVKSDPFRLRSTDLFNAKVLLMLAK